MSKGMGNIQRRVLDAMAQLGRTDTFELTAAVFDVKPAEDGTRWLSAAQLGSVRRAVRRLAKLGLLGQRGRRSQRSRQEIVSTMEEVRFAEFVRTYAVRLRGRSDDEE
jgi:hypothetical protein